MVDVLNRVFDGDHATPFLGNNLVEHRGNRGGFAVASGCRKENQAMLLFREKLYGVWKTEILHLRDLLIEDADGDAYPSRIFKNIEAGTDRLLLGKRNGIRCIDISLFREDFLLGTRQEDFCEALDGVLGEWGFTEWDKTAIPIPEDGNGISREVYVGCLSRQGGME